MEESASSVNVDKFLEAHPEARSYGVNVAAFRTELIDPAHFTVTVPIVVVSANILTHSEVWQARTRRHAKESSATFDAMTLTGLTPSERMPHEGRLRATFTRIGGRKIDKEENLTMAFKVVKDTCAAWLAVNDADDRIDWLYDQKPDNKKSTHITIEFQRVP